MSSNTSKLMESHPGKTLLIGSAASKFHKFWICFCVLLLRDGFSVLGLLGAVPGNTVNRLAG
jgi:hypothetical protein